MHRKLLLSLLFLNIAMCAFAQHINKTELDTLFNRLDRNKKLMGSVLIARGGKTLYQRGFGQARTGSITGIGNKPETIYRIGSISKMFTAAIIFKLVEDKKLKLADILAKWFPQLPNASSITIDQLLTHHSGLHNFTEDSTFISWQDTVHSKAQVLEKLALQVPDFAPGNKAEYSNTNFVLLGYIIEAVTGMPYAQVLRNRITMPLKLSGTSFGARKIRPEAGEALSYGIEQGEWVVESPSNTEVAGGAGGIVSTVGDMAKFIDALMLRHFLSDASLKKMTELKDGYGRGIVKFPFYDKVAFGHNGHIDNFTSMLAFFPNDSTEVSIACNGVNYNFNNMVINVLSSYYSRPFKMPDFDRKTNVSPIALKKLEGVYTNNDVKMDITITANESGITAQATGQSSFPLEAVSEKEFGNDDVGIHLIFIQNGKEQASKMMLMQGGSRIPFVRKP